MSGISIERLLDRIESDISNSLIFVGVLDNNAKLLSFRRGKASFSLPIERHDTLDVQLSLMFSLIKQLEDISGTHKFTETRFVKHDIFLFGIAGVHIFVITSPTSGQVSRTLEELVASMSEVEPPVTASTMTNRGSEQTMTPAMPSFRREQPNNETQKFSQSRPRPEAITLLQGYLMALEADCTIQEDVGGFYKIKANNRDGQLSWTMLEKISSTFNNRIEIQHFGTDPDGRVYLTISVK